MMAIIALTLVGLIIMVLLCNRLRRPDYDAVEQYALQGSLPPVGTTLDLLTWNIGYAGLGQDAEFFMDGGKSLRPLNRIQIKAAASGVAEAIATKRWDMACIQESAEAGFLTRGQDVRHILDTALHDTHQVFWSDMKSILIPRALRFRHGMATYARCTVEAASVLPMPNADTLFLGFLRKAYVGLVTRAPINGTNKQWVVINLHLPIYDATSAERVRQLDHLFAFAQKEVEAGNFVVIGGDWNMRLSTTTFPGTTTADHHTWVTDLPDGTIPAGWQWGIDTASPTVRALDSPFLQGQTYATIFDGFLVSPNVSVDAVVTDNRGFDLSDHHPVAARFTAQMT